MALCRRSLLKDQDNKQYRDKKNNILGKQQNKGTKPVLFLIQSSRQKNHRENMSNSQVKRDEVLEADSDKFWMHSLRSTESDEVEHTSFNA